mgnify:CR=1 FL=1
MDLFHVLEYLHILGAMVLFGTGLGIAFFMYMADRSGDVALIAGTARIVVIADFVFTATAVVVQPVTGLAMVMLSGHTLDESWIVVSLALFVMIGLLWLPVVWMQNERWPSPRAIPVRCFPRVTGSICVCGSGWAGRHFSASWSFSI